MDQVGKHSKEWFLLLANLHIEVFDVCRSNPKVMLHFEDTGKHLFVMGGVGDIGEHITIK